MGEYLDQYNLLLIQTFKVFKTYRESYFSPPKVSQDLEGAFKCLLKGTRTMIKEGRDYWYKTLEQQGVDKDDDGKCRGKCDVMSTKLCEVRPETGKGLAYSKYCVKDDKISKAANCFKEYKRQVLGELTGKFGGFIQELQALHEKVKHAK